MAARVPNPDPKSVDIAGIAGRIYSNHIINQTVPPIIDNEKNRKASVVVSTAKESERQRLTAGNSNIIEAIKDGLRSAGVALPRDNNQLATLVQHCTTGYDREPGDLLAKRTAAKQRGIDFLITPDEVDNFNRNIADQERQEVAATTVQAVVRGRQAPANLPKNIVDPINPPLNPNNIPLWNPDALPDVPEAETPNDQQLQYFPALHPIDSLRESQTNLPNPINYEEFEIMNELDRLNRSINVARSQEVIFTNKILKELELTYNEFIQALEMCRTPQEIAQAAREGGMAKLNPSLYRHLLHTIRTQITANRNVGKNIDMRRIKSKIRAILDSHVTQLRSTVIPAQRVSTRQALAVLPDFQRIENPPDPRLTGGWKYISKKRTRKFKKTKKRKSRTRR